jgi:predicted nucleotidyltransferase
MRSFGFTPEELKSIKNLFQKHFGDLPDAKIYLFGSRSKGTHKKYSDVDLAVKTKAKEISKRIALFKASWEETKIPYKVDITSWKDIYKPYLQDIRKTKKIIWTPEDKELHPWRVCPYGEHWVVRHPRYPVGRQIQDVDGHCRKNPSGKDRLKGDEIELISRISYFQSTRPLPCPYQGKSKIPNANDYDIFIAGWCKYWNDIFKPEILIDPNFVKALIESETHFRPNTNTPNNKKIIGPARGLIQITEQTWRILKSSKGEMKDYYIDLSKDELFEPEKNICAGIRWLFRKKEILQKRLKKEPTWVEVMLEYKGLYAQYKKNGKVAVEINDRFMKILSQYKC